MNLNINNSDDKSYRYKMAGIIGKIESRGNGVKTILTNIDSISGSLARSVIQISKFISLQLGTKLEVHEEINKIVLKGDFSNEVLQKSIFDYINIFVLCKKCQNPETVQIFIKDRLRHNCKACGFESKPIDHKLTTFIIKELSITDKTSTHKQYTKDLKKKLKKCVNENTDISLKYMNPESGLVLIVLLLYSKLDDNPDVVKLILWAKPYTDKYKELMFGLLEYFYNNESLRLQPQLQSFINILKKTVSKQDIKDYISDVFIPISVNNDSEFFLDVERPSIRVINEVKNKILAL